ncbi:MAG: hypothetical protein ACREBV_09850 [Candidatus Zixiibacteriota bacterium]
MPKFLIEVPHEAGEMACIRAIQILQDYGSHYITNADFGCMDDVHKAWLTVDVDTKEEARMMVPPVFRESSTITVLCKFTPDELSEMLKKHGKQ